MSFIQKLIVLILSVDNTFDNLIDSYHRDDNEIYPWFILDGVKQKACTDVVQHYIGKHLTFSTLDKAVLCRYIAAVAVNKAVDSNPEYCTTSRWISACVLNKLAKAGIVQVNDNLAVFNQDKLLSWADSVQPTKIVADDSTKVDLPTTLHTIRRLYKSRLHNPVQNKQYTLCRSSNGPTGEAVSFSVDLASLSDKARISLDNLYQLSYKGCTVYVSTYYNTSLSTRVAHIQVLTNYQ